MRLVRLTFNLSLCQKQRERVDDVLPLGSNRSKVTRLFVLYIKFIKALKNKHLSFLLTDVKIISKKLLFVIRERTFD